MTLEGDAHPVDGAPPLVVRLDGHLDDTRRLGGKGAWLDRLLAAGFDVPATAVVTTDAYRRLLDRPEVIGLLDELAAARAAGEAFPDARAVDDVFLTVDIDDDLRAAIDTAGRLAGGDRFAVRSSASAEDLHGTSFAGQYRSVIDVAPDQLEQAVRLVWASLWHPSPRAYREAQGVDETDLGMAVVVMAQVPAEHAGVAFTVDPGGDIAGVRVEGVAGQGEQLVSGAVTPWVAHVPRAAPGDGDVVLDGDAPADTEELARRVAVLALAIEEAFGEPQDIEWAIVGDHLQVLQARPITSIGPRDDGFDSPIRPDERWTTAGIAEMLPGVLPPLLWEVNRQLVEEALRNHFASLHVLPATIDRTGCFIGRFRGQAALSLDAMERIVTTIPGGQVEHVEEQYFGVATGEQPAAPRRRRGWRGVAYDARVARERREALIESATVLEASRVLEATPIDLTTSSDRALLAHRRRLLDLAGRAMTTELAMAASAVAAYRRLELVLLKRLDQREASQWAQRLTAGSVGGAAPHEPRPSASRALVAGPTWAEVGGERLPTSGGPVDTTTAAAWEALIERMRSLHGWASTRALTGQVVDVRLLVLRRLVEDANELLGLREATKAAVLLVGGLIRSTHLELGRRLVDRGVLEAATDVDYLSERELTGAQRMPSRVEIARRRRWLAGRADHPLPQRFRGAPTDETTPRSGGPVLHGWAAGPGRHTGRARVLRTPTPELVAPGDVVVAHTTDASWAPVFLRAGAIVVEQGGPLSHAAIVARELGIPAVLHVPDATDRLAGDDVTVTVDGDEGVVEILERDPANALTGDPGSDRPSTAASG